MKSLFLFPLIFLFLLACNKGNNPNAANKPSSDKSITGVTFKAADNPSLSADIPGTVSADIIKLEFPQPVPLIGLIPTIEFSGKSISPENRTPQNFTTPVIYQITADDGSTKRFTFQAGRISSDSAKLVLGRWSVLKDSVSNVGNYVGVDGGIPNQGVYIGVPSDYNEFGANGVATFHENNQTYSDSFRILPNKRLDVKTWTQFYNYGIIEVLTNNYFTFRYANTSSNGGKYFRRVQLKR